LINIDNFPKLERTSVLKINTLSRGKFAGQVWGAARQSGAKRGVQAYCIYKIYSV
jgi:hypothetical protein